MPTKKKPLNLSRGDGRIHALGLSPFASLSDDAQSADPDSAVESFDAGAVALLGRVGDLRRKAVNNPGLNTQGRQAELNKIGVAVRADLLAGARPVVPLLAAVLRKAGETSGVRGDMLTGAEVARHVAGSVAPSAWQTTRGILARERLRVAADELVRLERANDSDGISSALADAADSGDAELFAALDLALPIFVRARVLRTAGIDADRDAALHRRLRQRLNPTAAARIDALHELATHFLGNVRAAFDAASKAGLANPGAPTSERRPAHDAALDRLLAPLDRLLSGTADVPTAAAPSLDPN